MQKSTNYGLNLPDLADQYNLEHWNENTEKLDLELKKETDSRINTDNQLQSNIDNSVSTLRNEISTAETNAKNLENATGVLSISKGGTGKTTAVDACIELINALETGQDTPKDGDFYIAQYAGGSELPDTNTNKKRYYRRPLSALWNYIQSKISSVLGLTSTQYNGNAKTATKLATTRTINIQDASATNTGTGAGFDGGENAIIKLPSTIKANITGNCSGSSGSCTGNSATATQATGPTPFNASQQNVTPGTVTRAVAQCVMKSGNGYISRIALGLTNKFGQFSDGIISLGDNDSGTEWEDFIFKKGTGGEVITSATINNQTVNNANNAYRGMVHTCSTDAKTVAKTVSVTGFTLATGACVRVLFTNGNNVASPTLNVNNTGAKEIRVNVGGTIKPLSSDYGSSIKGAYYWKQNVILELYYNGTYWVVMNDTIVAEFLDNNWHHEELYISGKKKIWGYLLYAVNLTTVPFTYKFNGAFSYSLVTGGYKSYDNNFGGILVKVKEKDHFEYVTSYSEGTDKNVSGYFIAEGY